MQRLIRDGVGLCYEEAGQGGPPMLLIHGFACGHTHLAPQLARYARERRVVSLDLRGHGQSDAPDSEYSFGEFADDVAWLCRELGVYQPVVIGHSLGGCVALKLAAEYPDLPSAIVMLDSPVVLPVGTSEFLAPLSEAINSPGYAQALQQFMSMSFLPSDDQERKARILQEMSTLPQHVVQRGWRGLIDEDTDTLAVKCKVPALYIDAGAPNCDLARFQQLTPQLVVGRTVGSGHWNQLEVPDQVHAMIDRYLRNLAQAPVPVPA